MTTATAPVVTAQTIWSEGSRLAGSLVAPPPGKGNGGGILLCHGWGGRKEHLVERYAHHFALAGFMVLAFDYRGWGESDGKIIPDAETPPLLVAGKATVPVRIVREIVDPLDQIADIRACFAWLASQEGVDPGRVGLWGSSYGGGHVITVAAQEPRVRAVVAQIGGYGHPPDDWYRVLAWKRMADRARGLIDPPIPQGIDGAPGLLGTPDVARQYGHAPLAYAADVRVPTLFLDAEFEEYNSAALQGGAAHAIVRANCISEQHLFPCSHYKVYDEYLLPARALALNWFQRHL